MASSKENLAVSDGSLDTLALQASNSNTNYYSEETEILRGTGSCKDSIRKRPKKKFITQSLSLALVDVATANGDQKWIQKYWNTYHCQNRLTTYEGRAYGYYCKNRWCSICVANRKADLINKYHPVLNTWSDIHFLTLTVKAQPHQNLNKWIGGMIKALSKILKNANQKYRRGKGPRLKGIKSLECNYNPIKKTYNPHYHILTDSKETAEIIKSEWVKIWTSKFALPYLQKVRKVQHTEKDIIETIKYGAKIFTDPMMTKTKVKKDHAIYAAALHEIYKAMSEHQLFGKFGFQLAKNTHAVSKGKRALQTQKWVYESSLTDWVNIDTGQIMTQYMPDQELKNIINNRIDTNLK